MREITGDAVRVLSGDICKGGEVRGRRYGGGGRGAAARHHDSPE